MRLDCLTDLYCALYCYCLWKNVIVSESSLAYHHIRLEPLTAKPYIPYKGIESTAT